MKNLDLEIVGEVKLENYFQDFESITQKEISNVNNFELTDTGKLIKQIPYQDVNKRQYFFAKYENEKENQFFVIQYWDKGNGFYSLRSNKSVPLFENKQKSGLLNSWQEFHKTGLLLFVNQFLHIFGWSLVYTIDSETFEVKDVRPIRTKDKGFKQESVDEAYKNLSKYIKDNAKDL